MVKTKKILKMLIFISPILAGLLGGWFFYEKYITCNPWLVDFDVYFVSDKNEIFTDYGENRIDLKSIRRGESINQTIELWTTKNSVSDIQMDISINKARCNYNDAYSKIKLNKFIVNINGEKQSIQGKLPRVLYPINYESDNQIYNVELSYIDDYKTEVKINVHWLPSDEFEKLKNEYQKNNDKQAENVVSSSKKEIFQDPNLQITTLPISTTTPYTITAVKINQTTIKQAQIVHNTEDPKTVSQWTSSTNSIVINGSYFHEDYTPSGYLVVNGKRIGERMFDQDKSGLLVIDNGKVILRDLKEKPIQKDETFEFALQSYPFLIKNSQPAVKEDSGKVARRTAVGTDEEGNVYLLLSDSSTLSLYEFAQALSKSEIKFKDVLNLDGGPSSGMYINYKDYKKNINSFSSVPNVLIISL